MKRFFSNIKKYYKYAVYQAKAELKSEIANSYLNWVWWFLDPICYMLIYTFIVEIVFKTSEPYFPVFVFLGLTAWDLFNRTVTGSVKLVKNNVGTINKVYVPKYIFLLSKSFVFLFKYIISFIVTIALMIFPSTSYMASVKFPTCIIMLVYSSIWSWNNTITFWGIRGRFIKYYEYSI